MSFEFEFVTVRAEISHAHTVGRCARRIGDNQPGLVVTDIAMPVMDGYAMTTLLREKPYGKEMKIVALSAFPAGRGVVRTAS